ncbi:MAG: Rne/Rng family ribonuclease [Hyphomicrobiales bacterium]
MSNRMLIDANHDEETRVIVLNNSGKIQEFDIEAKDRHQIRGNIYLAKVTRVEPSLQAAFVEYGGNRHGFLAFNEIHPDYYQIPTSEKEKIIQEEVEPITEIDTNKGEVEEADSHETSDGTDSNDNEEIINDEQPEKFSKHKKRYKIQEVIKKRQIILIQVTKEERGNKGAALTTYISLAGRYCVLMPNTARGGGISRKISDLKTRNKIKDSMSSIKIPDGMGVIIRTAGAQRTKTEIKRDFEYLIRLWQTIRKLTLNSSAPALIYEEGSLVKRSIRDLYNKEIDEIIVSGDNAFDEAKSFMKMLIPSHVKFIKKYKEDVPLFISFSAESELQNMYQANVSLPSGGYLVINQTEALVAIDVNSGRSTREHNIEDTALRTNIEASDEIARQLRLRDLAGLIVIDYIDMEERKNNRSVERQLKEALKVDRARIQVGHISQFGLMEMSRQRMRSSLIESSMSKCNYCNGLGRVSSVSSQSVQIIRAIEQDLIDNGRNNISLQTNHSLTDYLLNKKRRDIFEIEQKYNISITIVTEQLDEEKIYNINHHPIETAPMAQSTPLSIDSVYDEKKPEEDSQDEETTDSKNRKQIKNTKKQQNRKNTKTRSLSKSKSATEDENEGTKKESKEKPKGTRKKQPVKKEVVESKTINSDKKEDNDTKTKTKTRRKSTQQKNKTKENDNIKKEIIDNPKTGWWDE